MHRFHAAQSRTGTASIKWDRYHQKFQTDRALIPLWIADTDFLAPAEVIEAIHTRTEQGIFGYSFASEEYLQAVCGWFRSRHSLDISPEWVVPTHGVVTALRFTIEALTNLGEQVLIFTPAYDPFFEIIRNTGRVCVEEPLVLREGRYELNFQDFERALQHGVKLVIFCNPHNPVGRVWTQEELEQVSSLCGKYGVYLASDEIHCDLALFGHRYISMASLGPARNLTAVYTSAGKAFSLTGLCASNLIIPDKALRARIAGYIRQAWILSPNVFGLVATQAAYQYGGPWLDEELSYLEGNSNLVCAFLAEHLPRIKSVLHEGTFLMWLDFSAYGLSDSALEQQILGTCGLGLGVGSHYGTQYGQFMRLNIGCDRSLLAQALKNLCRLGS